MYSAHAKDTIGLSWNNQIDPSLQKFLRVKLV